MKHQRKSFLIISLLAFSFFFSLPAVALNGEKVVGLRGGVTTTHDAPVAGLFFSYRFTGHFRLASSIDYYFKKNSTDAFSLNVDANVPFALGSKGRFGIYPLAGASLTSWNFHNTADNDDSTTRKVRLGLNFGGGLAFRPTEHLRLAFEGKYSYVKHYDGGIFTLSIGYIF